MHCIIDLGASVGCVAIQCRCWLQRKKTLLVEYKELQKSNAFIDRRFGGGPHAATVYL
jgi:hypothetical protein